MSRTDVIRRKLLASTAATRLPGLGVYEHWDNPQEKKPSRNLGLAEAIELVAVS